MDKVDDSTCCIEGCGDPAVYVAGAAENANDRFGLAAFDMDGNELTDHTHPLCQKHLDEIVQDSLQEDFGVN